MIYPRPPTLIHTQMSTLYDKFVNSSHNLRNKRSPPSTQQKMKDFYENSVHFGKDYMIMDIKHHILPKQEESN